MPQEELERILEFISRAENLKNTLRHAFTSQGRQESTAEHSWRLCLLLMACAHRFPNLQLEKMLKIAIVHDLAEAICGDTPAPAQGEHEIKAANERHALTELAQELPEGVKNELLQLWEEYECASSGEAKCVKAFDKLETLIQHNQGRNPRDFDYAFNLTYGLEQTNANDTARRMRRFVDANTKRLLESSQTA
ncbi:HD domain-containing protein [Desulfovibrio sp. OttesenSCG-928-G15]|nr:HD domain-containing protein [Desulfovibrio sp. OttesenSCG-928-G15]